MARSKKRLWRWFSSTILSNLARDARRNGLISLQLLKRAPKRTHALIPRIGPVLARRVWNCAGLSFPELWAGETRSEFRLSSGAVASLLRRGFLQVIHISESGLVPFSAQSPLRL